MVCKYVMSTWKLAGHHLSLVFKIKHIWCMEVRWLFCLRCSWWYADHFQLHSWHIRSWYPLPVLIVLTHTQMFCSEDCKVYDIPLLFIVLHPSWSSTLFTYRYFADDARSLSICSLFVSRNALPFILPLIISRNTTLFLSMCTSHMCFHCQIHFLKNRHIYYFVLPADLSILLQIQLSKACKEWVCRV